MEKKLENKTDSNKYFKCYWSKDLKKKNKSMEDGLLLFVNKKVKLYDLEGLFITSSPILKIYYPDRSNTDVLNFGCVYGNKY